MRQEPPTELVLVTAMLAGLDREHLDTGAIAPRTPALCRMLYRGDVTAGPTGDSPAGLMRLFGYAPMENADPPVAAVSYLGEGGDPGAACWLRADPVYLRPDVARLHLFSGPDLQLNLPEAQALAATLRQWLEGDGLGLDVRAPLRWYMRLPAAAELHTTPLQEASGGDIRRHLPSGAAAKRWHARLNEIQMLLHDHPVNLAREKKGQAPINSLWLWGAGSLPRAIASPFRRVWADEPLARGLGRLGGSDIAAPPATAAAWWGSNPAPGRHLLVLESTPVEDAAIWRERMEALETQWFVELERLLRRRRLQRLVIHPGDGRSHAVTPAQLRRFWRGTRPLSVCLTGR